MTFWIITIAMALIVTALLVLAILRSRPQDDTGEPAAGYDLQVYREQLREIDRDLARGVIGQADAERVRVEVSRRILAADARAQSGTRGQDRTKGPARAMAAAVALVTIAGTVLLYRGLGAPGYGDLGQKLRIELARQSYESRPAQEEAEAQAPPNLPVELDEEYKAVIEKLRIKVAGQPDDLQGQVLLALHEARSGNLVAARTAQARVLELMGDAAGAEEYAQYGELLIIAANGYVSPQAEAALRAALDRDPAHGPARYYWGLMLAQTGRPDLAFRLWDSTLRQGPPDAPWLEPIRGLIGEMAWRAGINDYEIPAAPPAAPSLAGPTSEDVDAAAGMSEQDRRTMIRGMVERLSDRLASDGGSAAEWARLIGALGVLGDMERAQTVYDEAKLAFAADAAAQSTLRDAADRAGLGE